MRDFFKKLTEKLDNFDVTVTSGYKQKEKPLEQEFTETVRTLKEQNSQIVWSHYYVPKATRQLLDEQGNISVSDEKRITYLANSLMFKDMADGILTDLYKFKEVEHGTD